MQIFSSAQEHGEIENCSWMAKVEQWSGEECEEFFAILNQFSEETKTGNVLLARHRFDVRVKRRRRKKLQLCILFYIKEFSFYPGNICKLSQWNDFISC